MRILVITRSEWSDQNSIGNTVSNIFGNIHPDSIANISFRGGCPRNTVCRKYYVLNESIVLRSLGLFYLKGILNGFGSRKKALTSISEKESQDIENTLVAFFRGSTNMIVYLLQDLLWRFSWWKTKQLDLFLSDFKPDIIFFPSFGLPYTHRVARYIAKVASAPLVAFHADDYFFQANNGAGVIKRYFGSMRAEEIRRTINFAGLNYAISTKQSKIYSDYFGRDFKVMKKGIEINKISRINEIRHPNSSDGADGADGVVRFLYAGTLAYGRWKSIILLVNAMNTLRKKGLKFTLDIYSQYQLSNEVRKCVVVDNVSRFLGSISPKELALKFSEADVVLHVESFDDEDIELTRHSFSTKIIDCLGSSACTFGFGPPNIASMEFLVDNNLGVVCVSKDHIERVLASIHGRFDLLNRISSASRDFVMSNHDVRKIHNELHSDFCGVVDSFKGHNHASS